MAKQGSILIVDDEFGPRESLRLILDPIYTVHEAADGKEAIQRIQNEEIDLVTLDLDMPGPSGIEVLREIKKLKPHVEVIIITGYGTLTNAQGGIQYGAAGFISKPFNVADVISVVDKTFERQKYNQQVTNLIQQIKSLR